LRKKEEGKMGCCASTPQAGGGGGEEERERENEQQWQQAADGKLVRHKDAEESLLQAESKADALLAIIPGRMVSNGASEAACVFTQQGRKGTNQDAMVVWEVSKNNIHIINSNNNNHNRKNQNTTNSTHPNSRCFLQHISYSMC
jgi:hypothetical protein